MSAVSELLEKLEGEAALGYPEPWYPQDRVAAGLAAQLPAPDPTRVCRNGHTIDRWLDDEHGGCRVCRRLNQAKWRSHLRLLEEAS